MSPRLTTTLVAFGVLVLFVGLLLPAVITAANTDATVTENLNKSTPETVTDGLNITLTKSDGTNATIELEDTVTFESETNTLTEGDTVTYTINNETTNVTADAIDPNWAITTVEYSRTYGWAAGPKAFVGQLDVLLALLAFLLVMGGLWAVVP